MGAASCASPLEGLYGSSILGQPPGGVPMGAASWASPLDTSSLAPVAPEQTENSNFTHGKAALAMALQMAL